MTNPEDNGSKTVLLCEDEDSLRELMRASLGDGFTFVEAVDGRDAVRLIRELQPDVVLLDLMLPGKNGYEILEEVRRERATNETPIVVVTAWGHDRDEVLAAGADRFVPKPFVPDELKAVIEDLLDE